jgi:hypothetical protein
MPIHFSYADKTKSAATVSNNPDGIANRPPTFLFGHAQTTCGTPGVFPQMKPTRGSLTANGNRERACLHAGIEGYWG